MTRPTALRLALTALLAGLAVAATGCAPPSPGAPSAGGAASTGAAPVAPLTTTSVTSPPATAAPVSTTSAPAPIPPTTAPAAGIPVGPGPLARYAVQPQPAPGSCHYAYVGSDPLPDPHCTPGSLNPQVTQATIGSTICARGFTSAIRPPESITEPEKVASAAAYGYTGSLHVAEYDHLVSLELGGDPDAASNLWVEPPDNPNATSVANAKDRLENRLNGLVCSGRLALATAQLAVAANWVAAYQQYG